MLRTPLLVALVSCVLPAIARAELRLPRFFGDHMLVQAGKPVRVWGWCEPGGAVKVSLAERSGSAKAGEDGRFLVELAALDAGGPHRLEVGVEAGETLAFEDVLVGELWLCSGQSNMEWALEQASDAEVELSAADHPRLRLFQVERAMADAPQDNVVGEWKVCAPEGALGFSAVGYHFGRELLEALDVPIGLVQCAWGGTRAEPWTSRADLEAHPQLAPLAANPRGYEEANRPGVLFDGMIHPLLRASLRGVVWYQGESNCAEAGEYGTLFPHLIRSWRRRFADEQLSFYFVQLAPFDYHTSGMYAAEACAELREAQLRALELPRTGMVVTMDVGDVQDIHPGDKRSVGKRLALWALARDYGLELECSGPLYRSFERDGDALRVRFEHARGLRTRDGEAPSHLELAGADGVFHPAHGAIEGEELLVSSSAVSEPTAVRYAFRDDAVPNLENGAGLPASPFRTDGPSAGGER